MLERVGLVGRDFGELGGEMEADLPKKKHRPCGYQLETAQKLRSNVSTHMNLS